MNNAVSSLQSLLQNSAKQYPDNIAVRYKNSEISYKELDSISNKLSACLISRGVTPGSRVGVYIDKSIDAVTAIFGILKINACYVPLDPLAPPDRQRDIINDCKIEYLVSSSKKFAQIRQILKEQSCLKYIFILDIDSTEGKDNITGVNLLFKDEIFNLEINVPKQPAQEAVINPLAYILYTSGSTGQPKGVMISHNASLSFIDWAYDYFAISCNDIVSAHAPFHFDLSIFDIFVTIKAGAIICIVPQGLSVFPKSLADFIENEKISIWYSVPSILIQLILHGGLEKRDLRSMKQIIFAGEAFPVKYLRRLMLLIPHAEYYNLYGPTETNVCTYYHVKTIPESDDPIPIGKPCTYQELYIVDEQGKLIEDNRMGELFVSGPTLFEGYWNDPQKTESVLFKTPFSSSDKKVYKTGDMVILNNEQYLEYHGRTDNMIKSRGYRIELGEIESILSSNQKIEEVAAIAIPDEEIGNKIKVEIIAKEGIEINDTDIKNFCSKKLPHYMIPAIINFRDSFPRTSTGKIDREKLKEPTLSKN